MTAGERWASELPHLLKAIPPGYRLELTPTDDRGEDYTVRIARERDGSTMFADVGRVHAGLFEALEKAALYCVGVTDGRHERSAEERVLVRRRDVEHVALSMVDQFFDAEAPILNRLREVVRAGPLVRRNGQWHDA